MKAITVWQPWGSLISFGEKEYETRGWKTNYRGPLAIHAAQKIDKEICCYQPFNSALFRNDINALDMLPIGAIICICNLVDCLEITGRTKVQGVTVGAALVNGEKIIRGNELAFGDYTPGRFAWKLKDVHQLKEPIPTKGAQQLWNWDATPHLVTIDPYVCGNTRIWTPKGVISGSLADPGKDDAVRGLEVTP